MGRLRTIITYIQHAVSRPDQELSRAQIRLRFAIDLARHCFQELKYDQANQMAAALTYRTIFSLIPIVVLSLIVFKSSHAFSDKRQEFQNSIIHYLAPDIIVPGPVAARPPEHPASRPDDAADPATSPDTQSSAGETDQEALGKIIDHLARRVSRVDTGGVSVVGLLVLIWAALALVITIEQAFNRIYDCPTGRAWHLRITIYWAVITLGPVLLMVSIYLASLISSIAHAQLGALGGLLDVISQFTALASSWLLLFLMYRLLPNTRVQTSKAAIGALVAAILWETGKWGFHIYVARAVTISQFYGSLGLIPLFLLWVYITWRIVLFGLELTYTLQAMKGKTFKHEAQGAGRQVIIEGDWVLPVMSEVAIAFTQGRTATPSQIADTLGLPLRAVRHLARKLESAGLLHHVQNDRAADPDASYTLARPPQSLKIADLLAAARLLSAPDPQAADHPGWACLRQLVADQRNSTADLTLASIITPPPR